MSNGASQFGLARFSIVMFGRRCSFTAIPFERLLMAGVAMDALILSSPSPIGDPVRLRRYRPSITIGDANDSLERIAGERGVPVYDVRWPLGEDLRLLLREIRPDLLVASCFPWRIPTTILDVARHGGVNLHPSLLPRFRGPDPLFWAYRSGTTSWGVTVHQLSEAFDAGMIHAQAGFSIPNEMPGDMLERRAAKRGADLLLDTIARANQGRLQGHSQDESAATNQSWPGTDALLIDRTWDMQRVLNFVVGVQPLGYEPTIQTSRGLHGIRSAHRADHETGREETWLGLGNVCLSFADGSIEFRLA